MTVASCYTDYTIPAHMYFVYRNEMQYAIQFCVCNLDNSTAGYTCGDADRSQRLVFLVTTELHMSPSVVVSF